MAGNITQFPIPTKNINDYDLVSSLTEIDNLLINQGSITKRATVEKFDDRYFESNVVLVRSEADFGTAVSGEILLESKKVYKIIGSVIVNNTLVIPPQGEISIIFNSYTTDQLISNTPAETFLIKTNNATRIHLQRGRYTSATGLNKFISIVNDDPFFVKTTEFYFKSAVIENFVEFGLIQNVLGCVLSDFISIQNGKLVLDNCFGITANIGIFRNFISTGQPFVDIKTNMSQMELTGIAFQPTKGDSPMKIDPAITSTSGIAFGRTPYQGNVVGGILAFEDAGGGKVRVIVLGGTSFENNDFITIVNTTNYNQPAIQISNVVPFFFYGGSVPAGSFEITASFVGDDGTGNVALLNAGLTGLEVVPFFEEGIIEPITSITDSGGLALFTTSGTAPATGQSLYISGTNNYDQGGFAVNVSSTTFTLLDSLGQPVSFISAETPSNANFNTGSLDERNVVVNVSNSGGIIPDSQTLGNAILDNPISFASTTILTPILSANNFITDEVQRFKSLENGVLKYIGKTTVTVSISAKVVAEKQSGTASVFFINIMRKNNGDPSFVEIPNHPATRGEILSGKENTYPITAIIDEVSPGDEIAIGASTDTAFGVNINDVDVNIIK